MSHFTTDCLRCGVCCHSQSDTYVRVTGADWERLGDEAGRVAHFKGNRAYMRMNAGHCAALEVRRTADGATEFFCTIYERRPQTCRDLGRGTPQCEAEIERKAALVARVARVDPVEVSAPVTEISSSPAKDLSAVA